jgi:uncharacterized protein YoaH (UPF0181 family)
MMATSMREALDKIEAEDKKQTERTEKERKESRLGQDAQSLKRQKELEELRRSTDIKGKSVTSVKSAKERYDELMAQNAPSGAALAKTGLAGLAGGPMGLGLAAAKMMGSYIKASGISKNQAIDDLVSQGVSREEAESVVDAAIRGNPDITREQLSGSGRGGATERRERAAQDPILQNVISTMTGGQTTAPKGPVYVPGVGYTTGGYQAGQTPQPQVVGPGNQIVQASQQGLTGFGGYGPQQVIPQDAQQFTQTPTVQEPQDFWSIAEQIAMENR